MTSPAVPAITVVVCAYNGAATIGACLDALDEQSLRAQAQIVVVDDGSIDGTAARARRHGVEVVVHAANEGLSAARNTGIAAARAPVVAFTDDDCVPEPGWLAALLAAFERPDVVAAGGPVEIARVTTLVHGYLEDNPPLAPLELELAEHTSLVGRVALYLRRMWAPATPSEARGVYALAGANMAFRRGALEAIGGFHPAMRFGADDEYVCGRVRERYPGTPLRFEPGAVVRHDYRGSLSDLCRRNYAYGRGHARAFRMRTDQRWPILFPLPAVVLASAALPGRPYRRLARLAAVATLCYPQGPRAVLRRRRLAALAFSWLRLTEELAHDVGMATGLADPRCSPKGST